MQVQGELDGGDDADTGEGDDTLGGECSGGYTLHISNNILQCQWKILMRMRAWMINQKSMCLGHIYRTEYLFTPVV
jgi:hypothetical protein